MLSVFTYTKQFTPASVLAAHRHSDKLCIGEIEQKRAISLYRARIFKCLWGPGIDSKE
jgi:hypothetical protein